MKILLTALITVALCAASSTAAAQSWPDLSNPAAVEKAGANDVAVVIAVEDYAFLPDVPGATKNAADWEAFLSDGLGVDQVLMLTNQQAVREEMLAFAKKGAGAVSEGGTLWFVFIGHGGPSKAGDDGLLIGADGQQNAKSMASRGLPQQELLAALESGSQARTVVLIDACFSGRDSSGGALAKGTMPVLPVSTAPNVASSTVVMTAAKSDEFAGDLPGAGRPAFSYLVLGAMRGWADDGDGEVTAGEAVKFARRKLLGIGGRQQTPQLTGTDGVVLARGVSEPAPDVDAVADEQDANGGEPDELPVASEQPPVGDQKAMKVEDPKYTDGIPDNPFYIFAAAGGGAVDSFSSIGFSGDVGLGVKLNGFSQSKNELRAGLRFGIAVARNANAPGSEQTLPNGDQTFTDPIEDTSNTAWVVGPEFGKSWRSESGRGIMGDSVFTVSAVGLYGNLKQCNGWRADTSGTSRRIVCDTPKNANGYGGGASLAGQFGILRIGALFAFLVDFPIYASVNAGLAFDL